MKSKNKSEVKNLKKTISVLIKLNIFAMEASSKEPIGPTLGQYGVPINDFCEIFNNLTNNFKEQTLISTRVILFSDYSFEVSIRIPSIYFFLKKSLIFFNFNFAESKRKPGFFEIKNQYLPIFNKNIIYTIVHYISNNLQQIINEKSYFKKIKGSIRSAGFLIYTK
jgi:large subunit ribosomal protein L11